MQSNADVSFPTERGLSFAPGPCTNYKWEAAGPNPCRRCAELDGQIRSLETWNSSVLPGFHKHCHCRLVPVEDPASGMVFSCQFPYMTMQDIENAIGALFALEADYFSHRHFEAEGAEDLNPSAAWIDWLQNVVDTQDKATTNDPNAEGTTY